MNWTGSEKQITWAEKIKVELVEELDELESEITHALNLADDDPTPDNMDSLYRLSRLAANRGGYTAAIQAIKDCTDARWFIDYGRGDATGALRSAMSGSREMGGLI